MSWAGHYFEKVGVSGTEWGWAHCFIMSAQNTSDMFSMVRICSSGMYRLIRSVIFFCSNAFCFMSLNICLSFSWRENVTFKTNINSSRVATPPLKSCEVLFLEKNSLKFLNNILKIVKKNNWINKCAKFRGSRAIVGLVVLVLSCHCAFLGMLWVEKKCKSFEFC